MSGVKCSLISEQLEIFGKALDLLRVELDGLIVLAGFETVSQPNAISVGRLAPSGGRADDVPALAVAVGLVIPVLDAPVVSFTQRPLVFLAQPIGRAFGEI